MIREKITDVSNSNTEIIQNLILESRGKLSISGVKDVLSFDDQIVVLDTELGMLTIKGLDLRINKLSLDTTDVIIVGNIDSMIYSEKRDSRNSGFFNKIFK